MDFIAPITEFGSNEAFIWYLYNDLGSVDLSVAYAYTKDGVHYWSKWITAAELFHKGNNELVWRNYTRDEFFKIINNRTVLDIEIVYDFDQTPAGSTDPQDIRQFAFSIIRELQVKGISGIAYFSGSKSIHYSVLVPELRALSKVQRMEFKRRAIQPLSDRFSLKLWFGADAMKSSERNMIALEGAPHWKTGVRKSEVDFNEHH